MGCKPKSRYQGIHVFLSYFLLIHNQIHFIYLFEKKSYKVFLLPCSAENKLSGIFASIIITITNVLTVKRHDIKENSDGKTEENKLIYQSIMLSFLNNDWTWIQYGKRGK